MGRLAKACEHRVVDAPSEQVSRDARLTLNRLGIHPFEAILLACVIEVGLRAAGADRGEVLVMLRATDLRNRIFRATPGGDGYEREDVDSCLAEAADVIEDLERTIAQLRREVNNPQLTAEPAAPSLATEQAAPRVATAQPAGTSEAGPHLAPDDMVSGSGTAGCEPRRRPFIDLDLSPCQLELQLSGSNDLLGRAMVQLHKRDESTPGEEPGA